MNVRIGNDIRLNLTIRGARDFDQTNIKQIHAHLINKSMQMYGEPWVPGCCGCKCKYHHIPVNPAFGEGPLRPNYGHPWHCADHACCHHRRPAHIGCGHMNDFFTYHCAAKPLAEKNKIQVYFPAHDQISCGIYKLVIVLVVYESGWGRCNLHTYTIDYDNVFTLVSDGTGLSGDIVIDVDSDTVVPGDGGQGEGGSCNCDCAGMQELINALVQRINELEQHCSNCHCGEDTEFDVQPDTHTVEYGDVDVPKSFAVTSSMSWSVEEIE